jgi:hypothetical protein
VDFAGKQDFTKEKKNENTTHKNTGLSDGGSLRF